MGSSERIYLNYHRCQRLNVLYYYPEPQHPSEPKNEVEEETTFFVEVGEFVSVMYDLDNDQYQRSVESLVVPALKDRKHTLIFEQVIGQPGFFDIEVGKY